MSSATLSLADLRTHTAHRQAERLDPLVPVEREVAPAGAVDGFRPVSSRLGGRVGVLGVSGGVGVSTVALALAEGLGATRLVELTAPGFSGLAGASTAELGDDAGWSVGDRRGLRLERRHHLDARPLALDREGWEVWDLGTRLAQTPVDAVAYVVVAGCSSPGIRRLEALLDQPGSTAPVLTVITGVPGRRLPRPLRGALGLRLRAAASGGRLVLVPECPALRIAGITGDPLPRRLRAAVEPIVSWLEDLS